MKKLLICMTTILFLALILIGVYFVPTGWILLAALLFMAIFIVLNKKELALGVVLAMFLFGIILPFKHNIYYISHHIVIKDHKVIDQDSNTTYAINETFFESTLSQKEGKKYIACQHATLFGYPLADHFCYLIVGDKIYELSTSHHILRSLL